MRQESRKGHARSTRRLVLLDQAAHGIALVTCVTGGIVLESVVLMAAAAHHLASMGLRLSVEESSDEQPQSRSGSAAASLMQLGLWTCCMLLAICVTALGAHGLFHAEPLDVAAMAGFAAPGAVGAATTAVLACWAVHAGRGIDRADALLSAAPTVTALCIALTELGAGAGSLDALAGLLLVLLLCARTLLYLRAALD